MIGINVLLPNGYLINAPFVSGFKFQDFVFTNCLLKLSCSNSVRICNYRIRLYLNEAVESKIEAY